VHHQDDVQVIIKLNFLAGLDAPGPILFAKLRRVSQQLQSGTGLGED
jgi:hypothetical protein